MERLCTHCLKTEKCCFGEIAEFTASAVPKLDNEDEQRAKAFVAHQLIAKERIKARERICPNLNDIDPNYHGRELM